MAEATQIMFSHQEVVTALLKQHGVHEGLWQLTALFGFQAINIAHGASGQPGAGELVPAAVVPLLQVGIRRVDELNNLSVDASTVNPA